MNNLTRSLRLLKISAMIIIVPALVFAQWGSAELTALVTGADDDNVYANSLTLDESGTLHLIYAKTIQGGNLNIFYANKTLEGNWSEPLAIGNHNHNQEIPSIADKCYGGAVYIVYVEDEFLQLSVITEGNPEYFDLNIAGIEDVVSPAIAVDNAGNVHTACIVQLSGGIYKICYGYLNIMSGVFDFQIIANSDLPNPGGDEAMPDIAVLSNFSVVISYRGGEYTSSRMDIAQNTGLGGTTWDIDNVRPASFPPYNCGRSSILTDPDDNIHVAFGAATGDISSSILYTTKTGSATQYPVSMGTNGGISGKNPSITIDEEGNCYTTFDGLNGLFPTGMLYSSNNITGFWDTEYVTGGSYYTPSVVVDPQGNCSMVFNYEAGMDENDIYFYGFVETAGPEPDLSVELIPHAPPIHILPAGGSFQFDVSIENEDSVGVAFDAWIEAVLPDGSVYGPILLRENMFLNSGASFLRTDMTQNVPGSAPAGQYTYRINTGIYPDLIYDSDFFYFSKYIMESSSGELFGWGLYGFDSKESIQQSIPETMQILTAYPNPFNGSSIIHYKAMYFGSVEFNIYNVLGRKVYSHNLELIPGETLNLQWGGNDMNGNNLPSGIYLLEVSDGQLTETLKLQILR